MDVKHLTGLLVLLFVLTITACTEGGSQPASGGGNPRIVIEIPPTATVTADDTTRVIEVMEVFVTTYAAGGDITPYVLEGKLGDADPEFHTTAQHGAILNASVDHESVEFYQGTEAMVNTIWDCEGAIVSVGYVLEPTPDGDWKVSKVKSTRIKVLEWK